MPELPLAFEAKIEANIINKNYTVVMHEWYDYNANKGRTDMYSAARPPMMGSPARPAQYSTSVYDYENNRYYHTTAAAEGSLDNCSWGDMDHIVGRNMFGAEDNSAHITSTAEVINFGGRREETYDGTAMVRGIPCDKWINVYARLPTN
eukprot:SAG31_NODE_14219_length_820_cov_1.085992_1_plen_148_part_10